MPNKSDYSPEAAYERILDVLDKRGLLIERLPYTPGLLEEAVFFVYKMRFITQGEVRRLLGLDAAEYRKLIQQWNSGDEGNCVCRLARNPFADAEG